MEIRQSECGLLTATQQDAHALKLFVSESPEIDSYTSVRTPGCRYHLVMRSHLLSNGGQFQTRYVVITHKLVNCQHWRLKLVF